MKATGMCHTTYSDSFCYINFSIIRIRFISIHLTSSTYSNSITASRITHVTYRNGCGAICIAIRSYCYPMLTSNTSICTNTDATSCIGTFATYTSTGSYRNTINAKSLSMAANCQRMYPYSLTILSNCSATATHYASIGTNGYTGSRGIFVPLTVTIRILHNTINTAVFANSYISILSRRMSRMDFTCYYIVILYCSPWFFIACCF